MSASSPAPPPAHHKRCLSCAKEKAIEEFSGRATCDSCRVHKRLKCAAKISDQRQAVTILREETHVLKHQRDESESKLAVSQQEVARLTALLRTYAASALTRHAVYQHDRPFLSVEGPPDYSDVRYSSEAESKLAVSQHEVARLTALLRTSTQGSALANFGRPYSGNSAYTFTNSAPIPVIPSPAPLLGYRGDYSSGEYSSEGTQGIPHTTFGLGLAHFLPDPPGPNVQSAPGDQTEQQSNSLKRKEQSAIPPTSTIETEWQNLFDAAVVEFDLFPEPSAGQYMNI